MQAIAFRGDISVPFAAPCPVRADPAYTPLSPSVSPPAPQAGAVFHVERPALSVRALVEENGAFVPLSLAEACVVLHITDGDGCDGKDGPPFVLCPESTVASFPALRHTVSVKPGAGAPTSLGAYRLTLLLAGTRPTQAAKRATRGNMAVYFSADLGVADVLHAVRTEQRVMRVLCECTDGPDQHGSARHLLWEVTMDSSPAAREAAAALSEAQLHLLRQSTTTAAALQRELLQGTARHLENVTQAAARLSSDAPLQLQLVCANGQLYQMATPTPIAERFAGSAFSVPFCDSGGPIAQQAVGSEAEALASLRAARTAQMQAPPTSDPSQASSIHWSHALQFHEEYVRLRPRVFVSQLVSLIPPAAAARMSALGLNHTSEPEARAYLASLGQSPPEVAALFKAMVDAQRAKVGSNGRYGFDGRLAGIDTKVTRVNGKAKVTYTPEIDTKGDHMLHQGVQSLAEGAFYNLVQQQFPALGSGSTDAAAFLMIESNVAPASFPGYNATDESLSVSDCEDFGFNLKGPFTACDKLDRKTLLGLAEAVIETQTHHEVRGLRTELLHTLGCVHDYRQTQQAAHGVPGATHTDVRLCLGLAGAANQALNTATGPGPGGGPGPDAEQAYVAMINDPMKTGHCFCVQAEIRCLGKVPGKHADVTVNEVVAPSLEFLEGTANSVMLEAGEERDVICYAGSNNMRMSSALQQFNGQMMEFSTYQSICNEIRSKSIQSSSKHEAYPVNVVSREHPGFYKTMIMLGPDTVASVNRDHASPSAGLPCRQSIVPTAPCATGAVRMLSLHSALSARERTAIRALAAAQVAMFPKWVHCNALPIRAAGLVGVRTTDTAYIKHAPGDLDPHDIDRAMAQRAAIARKLGAVGHEPQGFFCTRLYFASPPRTAAGGA